MARTAALVDWPAAATLAITAERVRLCRQSRGLSQRELADHLQVSQSWVARVELGKQPISSPRLRSLCLVLGVQPGWLLAI